MLYNTRLDFNLCHKDLAYLSGTPGWFPLVHFGPQHPPAVSIFTHTQDTTTTTDQTKRGETSDVTWSTPKGSTSDLPDTYPSVFGQLLSCALNC